MHITPEIYRQSDRAARKSALRLIPYLFILYVIAYLDRINVSFAALQMNAELNLSSGAYGFGAGIFFIGYVIFEVPSNLMLEKIGPRIWISRIMITWGIISIWMAFVHDETSFYVLRFLLGVAEAGFFPGIILYLTGYFPLKWRARSISLFMTATAIAGLIGAPLSGTLLDMHGFMGYSGWQIMFFVEGIPAVILGIANLKLLPDSPMQVKWLNDEERKALLCVLQAEAPRDTTAIPLKERLSSLCRLETWLASLTYFSVVLCMYAISFWMPQIISVLSHARKDMTVALYVMLPYLAAALCMPLIGWNSDRTGERRKHILFCGVLMFAGLVIVSQADGVWLAIFGFSLAAIGNWGVLGPFWSQTTAFLGISAAAGIAFINSIGNFGGFFGPYVIGYLKDIFHGYAQGLLFVGVIPLLGVGLVLSGKRKTKLY